MDCHYFITSDLHFDHKKILNEYCHRPFGSLQEMNEGILKQFDELPDASDTVVINNGDLWLSQNTTLEEVVSWVKRMKGKNRQLWIILGNHDKQLSKKNKIWKTDFKSVESMFYFFGFDKVFYFPIVLNENLILSHEPIYLEQDSQFINVFGHIHDKDIEENYFEDKKIDVKKYFNVCWDKHHKILDLNLLF